MNGFSITPFRGLHLLLLLLTAVAALLIFLLLRKKPEARRFRFLIGVCLFNLALFTVYKLSLSRDAVYVSAYYPNGFNIFNELPLHLCNINLFLIPLGVWKRNRSIMGFSFFVAPLLYGLPTPLVLAGYMYAVCVLFRLTQSSGSISFS